MRHPFGTYSIWKVCWSFEETSATSSYNVVINLVTTVCLELI